THGSIDRRVRTLRKNSIYGKEECNAGTESQPQHSVQLGGGGIAAPRRASGRNSNRECGGNHSGGRTHALGEWRPGECVRKLGATRPIIATGLDRAGCRVSERIA